MWLKLNTPIEMSQPLPYDSAFIRMASNPLSHKHSMFVWGTILSQTKKLLSNKKNKNKVLSFIVNYKFRFLPCCSLLINLSGLPQTITKPLTQSVNVSQTEREKDNEKRCGSWFEEMLSFILWPQAPVRALAPVSFKRSASHVCAPVTC